MAETTDTTQPNTPDTSSGGHAHGEQLDQGTYEVIRNRLTSHGKSLRSKLDQLNEERKTVFGSIEFALQHTDRITTNHNCVPRDMAAVGDRILVGYNVTFGLKTDIDLGDVFAVYRFAEGKFEQRPLDIINDAEFRKDFQDLYRFYKKTVFAKFFIKGPFLYMKFRVGLDVNDFKAFKWSIATDDEGNATLTYVDNRSDHEVRYPTQHDFTWKRAGRDEQRPGKHPHVSIDDKVFIETVGGDLTIKIEDNTETGQGIYAEPVDDPDQTLDDAEYEYVIEGHLILLRIRPYQENIYRHFIFNTKLQEVYRCDAIGHACILLPDDHGLMFADGYYLASGQIQTFPGITASEGDKPGTGMVFERRITAPNGEDFLYVFYDRVSGTYALMAYNLIAQAVETPTVCNGYCFFEDGTLCYFKAGEDPQKHHIVQVWQTPIVGPNFEPEQTSDSFLYKIGNRDIVRGMAECVEVLGLIGRDDPYADLYLDIVGKATGLLDSYFWLSESACFTLADPLNEIKGAAQAAVGEFEKVTRIRKATLKQTSDTAQEAEDLVNRNAAKIYDNINIYVEALAALRSVRGKVIALRELRYADLPLIEKLEQDIQEQTDSLSQRTVDFLLQEDSLKPYEAASQAHEAAIANVTRVTEANELEENILKTSGDLEMLIEIVSNLKIEDATQRTAIIDAISSIFAMLNAARTKLSNRIQELGKSEGIAEFNSQLKLLNQSVVSYLDLSKTPEKTDMYLTKIMVQLEELEGRFAEFDEFVLQLVEKRDEVYNAFENRRVALVEKRNKRAEALAQAADRILRGIKSRIEAMSDINEINSYFAADLMIDKVRDIVDQLKGLDDSVKVDDIQSRVKTLREDAVRQLKDRLELQEDGNFIRFGRHRFSINIQDIDLTTVMRDDHMHLHLAGTRFFESIDDADFNATRPVWSQEVVSEDDTVYRAEYLAYLMYMECNDALHADTEQGSAREASGLLKQVQKFMAPRYAEGYTKGVHDHDAALILQSLIDLGEQIDLLRFSSDARALASVFWQTFEETTQRDVLAAQLSGYGTLSDLFPGTSEQQVYIAKATQLIREFNGANNLFDAGLVEQAGEYLFFQLMRGSSGFVISREANQLREVFEKYLKANRWGRKFTKATEALSDHPLERFALIRDWLNGFLTGGEGLIDSVGFDDSLNEAAALIFEGEASLAQTNRIIDAKVRDDVAGLVGSHKTIDQSTGQGVLKIDFNEYITRLKNFANKTVPRFDQYTDMKRSFIDTARDEMRLEEFEPKVLTSFVRNKLIDSVFLPLIGDNLAKQMGTAGENTRTDRMGLLLLISPPGYGKTTLMEYIANRLGIVFMKINGPAIGHGVTSLDPDEAPNASAREEVEKLNLAFEMGDNVLIYLDDIQHTNPELLQKFISLCDAQRRIEGVYKGKTRTYDLRGRRVAVVMAGNPYTESGEKFRIPDMLANRADTYNLGDIIGEHGDAFKQSYLENCLTSNPTLNALSSRSQGDVYNVIKIAQTGSREGIEFEGSYSAQDIDEMVNVMAKLMQVRDVILTVNQQYIASAGQEDQFRTEPPFQLQGSYRNMNRIAERIVPVMNDKELMSLIVTSYEQDAQTLTTGAEANLLKFREMLGIINEEEASRWSDIKETFVRNNAVAAMGGDAMAAAISQLAGFNQGLGEITSAIGAAVGAVAQAQDSRAADEAPAKQIDLAAQLAPALKHVEALGDRLDAIREALDRGADQLIEVSKPKKAKPTAKPPVMPSVIEAKLDPALIAAIEAMANKLDQLSQTAFAQAEPEHRVDSATPAPTKKPTQQSHDHLPHEIRVINKIPATFLYVMKEQFALMQGWLEPLTRITADQDDQLKGLHTKVETIIEKYDIMISKLEQRKLAGGSQAEIVDDDDDDEDDGA